MADRITVRYITQYILGDRDITNEFYAAQDCDAVRFWEGGFCLLEVMADADGAGWIATGGDGSWTTLGERAFSVPRDALHALLPADSYELVES